MRTVTQHGTAYIAHDTRSLVLIDVDGGSQNMLCGYASTYRDGLAVLTSSGWRVDGWITVPGGRGYTIPIVREVASA